MTHINVERLLRETPLSVEPSSIDAVHQRLFGPTKRSAPDHYEIHEELGRGGFGRVFRSIDKRYPREVALKVIHYHGAQQLARLEREARALAGLAHPNIVTVFDKGIADAGVYFLATERVVGTRLDAWMHDPARRLDEILAVFAQAAEGLHHAHQRGMIHRDFKPSNAIVDEDRRLRILDFGLVSLAAGGGADQVVEAGETVHEGEVPLTTAASHPNHDSTRSSDWSHGDGASPDDADSSAAADFRGTLAYASPEQLEGTAVDSRSDQFSLCVALFEACHGFRPFSGRTVLELSERMAARDVARGASRHRVPRWLARLLRRGLSPSPAERYQDVGEIAAILRAHLRPKPWLAMAAGVALTLGLVTGVWAATRPPTIDLDWRDAWPEDFQMAQVEALYGPGLGQSLRRFELEWQEARDAYAIASNREADGPVVECLGEAKQRFRGFVEDLREPAVARVVPPSLSEERIWLDHVSSPGDCRSAEPRWEANDALTDALVDAQAARLAGRYDDALEQLESVRDEPVLQHGRPSGLFNYELGVVQLHRQDPAAWRTLAAAALDTGDDLELRGEVLARQLEAGAVLQAAEPGEIDTLLWLIQERAEPSGPIEPLAEAYALEQRGRYREAERSYLGAREAFAALEPGPYRDTMIAQCTLNSSYSRFNVQSLDDDELDALEPALAMLGKWLGEGHPLCLRHAIKVAQVMGEARPEQAQRLLASAMAKREPDPGPPPSFDVLRAQAELLALDLERHDHGERLNGVDAAKKAAEWSAEATKLGTMLDARADGLGRSRRAEAYRVREILLSAHSAANEELRMARILEQMWDDAERLGNVATTCSYVSQAFDRSDEEKKRVSEEILEIEARLRTRCG